MILIKNNLFLVRQRFSEMDLKPIVEPPDDWRDLLPPKQMMEGAIFLSSESSDTTEPDEVCLALLTQKYALKFKFKVKVKPKV